MSRSRDFDMPGPEDISADAAELINKLLVVQPSQRLGFTGVEEVKSSPFFLRYIDWKIELWREPSMCAPELSDPLDTVRTRASIARPVGCGTALLARPNALAPLLRAQWPLRAQSSAAPASPELSGTCEPRAQQIETRCVTCSVSRARCHVLGVTCSQ